MPAGGYMNLSFLIILVLLSSFGNQITVETSTAIPKADRVSGAGGWTDWSYCTVSPDGRRAAFIIPLRGEVDVLDLSDEVARTLAAHDGEGSQAFMFSSSDIEDFDFRQWARTVARNGRKKDEVALPLSVHYSRTGNLLISDAGNRRILEFSPDNRLVRSFLLTGDLAAPNEVRVLPDNEFITAGLNLDPKSRLNAGNFCTVFDEAGELVRSFAYTPQSALEKKLWVGVSAVLDIDDEGIIYVSFSVEGDIYAYRSSGELIGKIDYHPAWFVAPPSLSEPDFVLERPPEGFWRSWTRIIKIIYAGDGRLVLAAETNGLVPGVEAPFIFDVLTTDGRVIQSGIPSQYWPVGRDRNNALYWLSFSGDSLVKTRLK